MVNVSPCMHLMLLYSLKSGFALDNLIHVMLSLFLWQDDYKIKQYNVLLNFVIILLRKREPITLLALSCCCVNISVLRVGLRTVIRAYMKLSSNNN